MIQRATANRRPSLVSEIMTAPVHTIGGNASARDASEHMRKERLRHLVVVDEASRTIGLVSDRDIRAAEPSLLLVRDAAMRANALSLLRVRDVMKANPHVIRPGDTIRSALVTMKRYKVGSLPVVDDGQRVVGILTGFDILDLTLRLLAE